MNAPVTRNTSLLIRAATIQDAPALAGLLTRVFTATYGAAIPAAILQSYLARTFAPAAIAADIERTDRTYVVACGDDRLAGVSVLAPNLPEQGALADAVELSRLYVDVDWHGRGVAVALLGHTMVAARTQGYAALWLCVWEQNARALAFYRKHGFTAFGRAPVWVDSIRFDDVCMQRKLYD